MLRRAQFDGFDLGIGAECAVLFEARVDLPAMMGAGGEDALQQGFQHRQVARELAVARAQNVLVVHMARAVIVLHPGEEGALCLANGNGVLIHAVRL